MGNSNTDVMIMVVAIVAGVLTLVFAGVYFLNRSVDKGSRERQR
jgi:hypothetical protein